MIAMTPAKTQLTFEEYLNLDAEGWIDRGLPEGRCEYVDKGDLFELLPESGLNDDIANYLFLMLFSAGVPSSLLRPGRCRVVIPVLKPKTPRTRYPDLVVLQPEHKAIVRNRLTIRADMPAPRLVVEVVSPQKKNRDRDYEAKREQYQARGIPEFWLIDLEKQTVTVLFLNDCSYSEVGVFSGDSRIESSTFPDLNLTAHQILTAGEDD
jgi:Uma2 family endonuclease